MIALKEVKLKVRQMGCLSRVRLVFKASDWADETSTKPITIDAELLVGRGKSVRIPVG